MATDLSRAKSTPASKYDAFVAAQLAQAEKRIRLLDLTAGLLGLAALSLAYVVAMLLCDSKLMLSQHARQLSLYVFLAGAAVYLFFVILRPLRLRVNPYYAARQVEQLLPDAKNSLVNWVDLHEQSLPPAIRGALAERAAKDLSHVDLDRAISGRRAAWMGGLASLFAIAFLVSFFLLGPSPFLSLLQRTFNPFGAVGVSTRTQLTILKPEGGNATVTVGRGLNFAVEVGGKVPDPRAADAVKLLYRYEEGDPWLERPLIPEANREWTTSLSALEVKNGFWYRIAGGDALTEEYRVGVRAAPALLDFLATYHFRPYVARADEVRRQRELKELRGTEVLLRVRTNRMLREGRLEFEGKDGTKILRGEVDPNDSQTFFVRLILEEEGKYRLYFTSTESEAYSDPAAYPVMVIPDHPPAVELTKPGQDIRLPTDALLHLEGKAGDDLGIQSLLLRMRISGGAKLRGQPYRSGDQLRLAGGGYPREVEYKDFVELGTVRDEAGQAFPLRAGMELEYWLEASDACDYPRANVAESKHYRVLLTDPEKNEPKRKQEKKQAEKNKKQHEQKQDQKLQKENQQRQQQRQEQQARNKEEENKSKDADKGAAGEQAQPKDGEQGNKSEGKENNGQQGENKDGQGQQNSQSQSERGAGGQQGENKDGQGQQNSSGENNASAKEDQTIEEQIKKALEKKDAKGEGKPDKGDQSEGAGAPQNKPDGGASGGTKANDASKDKGQPQGGTERAQGEEKGNQPAGSGEAGESKGKPQPMGQGHDPADGDKKAGGAKGQQGKRETAEEKKEKGGNRGAAKTEDGPKDDAKTEGKQGGSLPKHESSAQGESKPSGGKNEDAQTAKGQGKPDAGTQRRNATEKEIQDLARELASKDARRREEAKSQLERLKKEAADPDARAKAGEALDKLGEPDGPTDKAASKRGSGSSGEPKEERKDGEEAGSKDAGSSESKDGDKGKASGQKEGQGDKGRQGSSPSSGAQGTRSSEGGNTPGGGGARQRSGDGDSDGRGDALSPQPKAVKPRDHRAAQMQLEDFAKRVNKDILKEAGVSEEAWKKYLESKRRQLTPRERPRSEVPSAPQQANPLPSMGGRTIPSSATGQGDARAPDRGQPPPGYRDSFREFTRQMSEKK